MNEVVDQSNSPLYKKASKNMHVLRNQLGMNRIRPNIRVETAVDMNPYLDQAFIEEGLDMVALLEDARDIPAPVWGDVPFEEYARSLMEIKACRNPIPEHRRTLSSDISNNISIVPIPLRSDTGSDESVTPADFVYLQRTVDQLKKIENEPYIKCSCRTECLPNTCACYQASNRLYKGAAYTADGRILGLHPGDEHQALVMCGPMCTCRNDCCNRMFNHKYPNQLEVVRADEVKGLTVFTMVPLQLGDVICEIVGELNDKEVDGDDIYSSNYTYEIAKPDQEQMIQVFKDRLGRMVEMQRWANIPTNDIGLLKCGYKGNIARFINHGCFPNLRIIRVVVNRLRPAAHKLLLVACRPIPAGHELSYSYFDQYAKQPVFPCRCGTITCISGGLSGVWNLIQEKDEIVKHLLEHVRRLRHAVDVHVDEGVNTLEAAAAGMRIAKREALGTEDDPLDLSDCDDYVSNQAVPTENHMDRMVVSRWKIAMDLQNRRTEMPPPIPVLTVYAMLRANDCYRELFGMPPMEVTEAEVPIVQIDDEVVVIDDDSDDDEPMDQKPSKAGGADKTNWVPDGEENDVYPAGLIGEYVPGDDANMGGERPVGQHRDGQPSVKRERN